MPALARRNHDIGADENGFEEVYEPQKFQAEGGWSTVSKRTGRPGARR